MVEDYVASQTDQRSLTLVCGAETRLKVSCYIRLMKHYVKWMKKHYNNKKIAEDAVKQQITNLFLIFQIFYDLFSFPLFLYLFLHVLHHLFLKV